MTQPWEKLNVVLGAGPVGRALVAGLLELGRSVRVVTRSGQADVPGGVELVAGDVSRVEDARRVCEGAGVVYGCVGMTYENWPKLWPPLMKGMLAGAEAAGARFIFMDNLYMYGPQKNGALLNEDLPLTQYGKKPATRAAVTRLWQEAHAAGRVQVAAVRASDFYGPGVHNAALGDFTFGKIVAGKSAQVVGEIDHLHSFAYVPDIARALTSVGEADDSAMGQAWHVPNAKDRTVRELLELFASELDPGRKSKLKIQVAGPILLTIAGLFNGNLREMKEMLYQWTRPYRVDHLKFARAFWSDPTPFEQGIAATAAWYRTQ